MVLGQKLLRPCYEWETDGLHTLLRNDPEIASKRGRLQETIVGIDISGLRYASVDEIIVTANPRDLPA